MIEVKKDEWRIHADLAFADPRMPEVVPALRAAARRRPAAACGRVDDRANLRKSATRLFFSPNRRE
jgi:hypothetical protein